jgi:undecaprenyl diphosphate synthase
MKLFKPKKTAPAAALLPPPRHIAIIMDGNGRWATRRGLPRTAGHASGAETFRRIATYCKDIGVEYLTVYAFSTENWKRPADEVQTIMQLLERYLGEAIEKMERDGVRLRVLGDTTVLSNKLQNLIARTEQISKTLEGFQANICINYGGRDEILRAAEKLCHDALRSGANAQKPLTEAEFAKYLTTDGLPDPDLVIRPGGEMRISNFLLWQSAYSEFYFTDVLWPDFDSRELDKAIASYNNRERRFGGLQTDKARQDNTKHGGTTYK